MLLSPYYSSLEKQDLLINFSQRTDTLQGLNTFLDILLDIEQMERYVNEINILITLSSNQ